MIQLSRQVGISPAQREAAISGAIYVDEVCKSGVVDAGGEESTCSETVEGPPEWLATTVGSSVATVGESEAPVVEGPEAPKDEELGRVAEEEAEMEQEVGLDTTAGGAGDSGAGQNENDVDLSLGPEEGMLGVQWERWEQVAANASVTVSEAVSCGFHVKNKAIIAQKHTQTQKHTSKR